MKKTLKTLAYLAVSAIAGTAFAQNAWWIGNSYLIAAPNGENLAWFNASGSGNPNSFHGYDFGEVSSLQLAGQIKTSQDSADTYPAQIGYKFDDDDSTVVYTDLAWIGWNGDNNVFGYEPGDISSWSYPNPNYPDADSQVLDIDLSGLAPGEHTINVWFRAPKNSYGEYIWDSNDQQNYNATFTIPVSKTYTLVESADDLVVGADYLVVSTVDGVASALKNETSGDGIGVGVVAIDGTTAYASDDALVWKIMEGAETGLPAQGLRVLFNAASAKYAAAPDTASDGAQLLADRKDTLAQWTLDLSALPVVKFVSVSYADRSLQRDADADNAWFAAYDSAQAVLRLYKSDSTELQTVTFDANGGTYPAETMSMTYVVGSEYWGILKPSFADHEFLGWFDAQGKRVMNFSEVTAESTRDLTARWGRAGQAVTLNANGGACATDSLTCSGTYKGIPKPTLASFEFLGWFDEAGTRFQNGMPVTDATSLTLTARWGKAGQAVTLNANGGDCGTTSLTCSGTYKGIPKPSLAGFEFLGWFDETGTRIQNGMPVTDAASLTLTARWGRVGQTVTLNAKGGECATTTLTCSGTYKGLSLPTLVGNTFLGWFDEEIGGTRVKNGMPVTEDASRILYAHWREGTAVAAISGFSMSFRSAHAARGTSANYSLISDTNALQNGTYIILTDPDSSVALSSVTNGGYFNQTNIVVTNNVITTDNDSIVWKIVKNESGIALYNETVAKYAGHTGSKNTAQLQDIPYYHEITRASGLFQVTATSEARLLQYNKSNTRFAYYQASSKMTNILIYAKTAPNPTVTLQATSTNVYVGTEVTITATAENFDGDVDWEWAAAIGTANGATYKMTPTAVGEYEVIVEATSGSQRAEASVTINVVPDPAAPTVTLQATSTNVYVDTEVTITATAENFDGSVNWNWAAAIGTANGATYTMTPTAAGEYEVVAEATYGTQRAEASVTITVNPRTVTLTPTSTNVNVGATVTIAASAKGFSGEVDWDWVGNGTAVGNVFTLDTSVAGTYSVVAEATRGNEEAMAEVTITVNAGPPTYTLVTNAADIVVGASYLLVATGEGFTNAMKSVLTTASTKRLDVEDVAISADGKTIATDSTNIVWQIQQGAETGLPPQGLRVLYSAAAKKYAAAPSSSSGSAANAAQLLPDATNELAQWTIDTSDMPAVQFVCATRTNRFLQRNKDAQYAYFATYVSGHALPRLYRADSTVLQTVTFNANGGTYPAEYMTMTYVVGSEYWGILKPTFADHEFLGWFDAQGNRVLNFTKVTTESIRKLTARWGRAGQAVTLDSNGGDCATTSLTCSGTYAGIPKPTLAGFEFLGWFDEAGTRIQNGMPVTDATSLTLTARWGKAGQAVTLNANGGQCATTSLTCSGTYKGIPKPSLAGSEFLGWFDDQGTRFMNGMPVTDAASLTLTASWGQVGQTVTLDAKGGECATTTLTCSGTYKGLTLPTLAGSTFLGWFDAETDGNRVKNGTPVTGGAEKTLYAHWRENSTPLSIFGFTMSTRSSSGARDARSGDEQVSTLRFETVAGFVYEVQWTPALGGEWTVLKRWTAKVDGIEEVPVSFPASYSTGFFRFELFDEVE